MTMEHQELLDQPESANASAPLTGSAQMWACPVCWHTMTEEQSKGYRGCPNGMHFAQHIMVEEQPCPNCYGGHFRPCQWCGDTGRVVNVPNRERSAMSDHIHQTINKLNHCVHCGQPMDRQAQSSFAAPAGWASLVEAVMVWRKAEKRWAMMLLGELDGDSDEAKDITDRKLHAVRIAAEGIKAKPNAPGERPGATTKKETNAK